MAVPDAAAEHFAEVARTHRRCFWLDGAAGRDWSGRRSYIGWLSDDDLSLSYDASTGAVHRHQSGSSVRVSSDIFEALAREIHEGPAGAEWVGYFGYAARPDLPAASSSDLPDAVWMRPSRVRSFEHPEHAHVTSGATEAHDLEPGREAAYGEAFARVQAALRAGDSYEVNLTFRTTLDADLEPVATYLSLRRRNPAPYAGFIQHDVDGARAWLLSSSPERFVTIDGAGTAESRPIKGTTPRGATVEDDAWLHARLARDPRFRAENLMIVDLVRNDLGMVCRPGSVSVPGLMEVESHPSVHQLVSTVRGQLRDDVSTVEAVRALFPPGSMTGAPKRRTMQIIDAVEDTPRGAYAGAFGRITAEVADLGVTIRSLTTDGSGRWSLGTGGGITVHSTVDAELAEAQTKAARLLDVLTESAGSTPTPTHPLEVGQ